MSTADLPELLRRVDLFSALSDRDRKAIAKQMRIVDSPEGHAVVEEGGGAVGFHLILKGSAHVVVGEHTRRDLKPGDYFGEISLLDGKPRSATVTAGSALQTASLAAWDFTPILKDNPEIATGLLLGLCSKLRAAEADA